VTPDSVRIYINDTDAKKPRGGFAIGGYDFGKGITHEYLRVTDDSTRVYVQEPATKGPHRSGFAIGGYDFGKGDGVTEYFNVSSDAEVEEVAGKARILWYPKKEAFLTGRVLVESPDSVGTNAMATGYESKAIGDFSQALGYQARAKGDNSTAIGNHANAEGAASYAFGNYAMTADSGSYALGSGATATGLRSFALGSTGVDSAGVATSPTKAFGKYSYAIGMGSIANGKGAFAFGTKNIATGNYSMAMGYGSLTLSNYSTAMGYRSTSEGLISTAMGAYTKAIGNYSTASGFNTRADGEFATVFGYNAVASGYASMAVGRSSEAIGVGSMALGYFAKATGDYSFAAGRFTYAKAGEHVFGAYNDTTVANALFIVGMGTITGRKNAMVIDKNGYVSFPNSPSITVGVYPVESELGQGSLFLKSNNPSLTMEENDASNKRWIFNVRYGKLTFRESLSGTYYDRLTIVPGGNVGIGTTSPAQKLEIYGNIRLSGGDRIIEASSGYLDMRPHDGYYGLILRDYTGSSTIWSSFRTVNATTDYLHISMNSTSTVEGLIISDNGYVGIGTTIPHQKLEINGNLCFQTGNDRYIGLADATKTLNIGPIYSTSTQPWGVLVRAHGYIAMRIDGDVSKGIHMNSSGYVGFGLTNPVYRIDLPNSNSYSGKARAYQWVTYSDERVKTDAVSLTYGLREVMMLQPKRYNHHSSSFEKGDLQLMSEKDNTIGLFAQEVYEIIPEAAVKPENDKEQLWGLDYQKLIPVLVKAIQEQQEQVKQLRKENEKLQARIGKIVSDNQKLADLQQEVDELKQILGAMAKK
jgi:hypothetical protein